VPATGGVAATGAPTTGATATTAQSYPSLLD
jgi:hypothetical protein